MTTLDVNYVYAHVSANIMGNLSISSTAQSPINIDSIKFIQGPIIDREGFFFPAIGTHSLRIVGPNAQARALYADDGLPGVSKIAPSIISWSDIAIPTSAAITEYCRNAVPSFSLTADVARAHILRVAGQVSAPITIRGANCALSRDLIPQMAYEPNETIMLPSAASCEGQCAGYIPFPGTVLTVNDGTHTWESLGEEMWFISNGARWFAVSGSGDAI